MTQTERREWLIKYLLNEPNSPDEYKKIEIPPNEGKDVQKDLLRSLMNVRPPRPVSEEFFKIQDEYLKERNKERGITDIATLKSVPSDKRLFLWQGDITTPQIPRCSAALPRSTRASTTVFTHSPEFS